VFISQIPHQYLGGNLKPFLFLEALAFLGSETVAVIEIFGKVLNSVGWLAFILNLLSNLLLQMTLQLVFTLMNTLQFLLHFPMIKANLPSDVYRFLSLFMALV